MPFVRLPGGIVAHVKMAKPRRRRCCVDACLIAATKQCDYALGKGRTCDAYICGRHAASVGPDLDHCPTHARAQAGLFTGLMP
jgi:hypothetical protein